MASMLVTASGRDIAMLRRQAQFSENGSLDNRLEIAILISEPRKIRRGVAM